MRFKTKLTAIMLTIAMLIAIIPLTAMGAGPELSIDKTEYAAGGTISITYKGVLKTSLNSWIAVAPQGGAAGAYLDWKYVKEDSGVLQLTAPTSNGAFEVRLYQGTNAVEENLIRSTAVTFTISDGTHPHGVPTVHLDKTKYSAGETIKITYYDVYKMSNLSWIAVAPQGAAVNNYLDWEYAKEKSGSLQLTAPTENGAYEIRIFLGYNATEENLVAGSTVTFTVGDGNAVPVAPPTTQPPTTSTPTTQPPTTEASPPTTTPPSSTGVSVGTPEFLAVQTGIKLEWKAVSGAVGYRVYRSKTSGVEGISITDFMITATSYVDVNVDANTTYYYTIRAVMKEANTATGEREQLSDPSAEFSVKSGSSILGGNASELGETKKNVILMKVDNPNMSVNGVEQLVDPDYPNLKTSPIVANGRTMVPIRAVIEAMKGTVGWDAGTQKITLAASGHTVEMWLNKKDLIVDGTSKEMDIAPYTVNNRTVVPVRFAAENVGCVVDWIGSTQEIVVVFYTGGTPPADVTTPTTPPPTTTAPPATTEPPNDDTQSGIPQGTSGIVGVWFGLYNTLSAVGPQSGLSVRYRVFYEDGTFRAGLPSSGLIDFDKENDKKENPDFWGTYTMSGDAGTWKISYSDDVHNLLLEKDGGLNIGSSIYTSFYRCLSVDNYKLNGSYTSHYDTLNDFKDSDMKPIIHFKSDGTFVDEGIIHNGAYGYDENENRPGSGSYELNNYTLTLRYTDGRIRRIACTFGYGLNNKDASEYFVVNNGSVLSKLS